MRGKVQDLLNKRFGKLLVLSKIEPTIHHTKWTCKCDCGNITVVGASNLIRGLTKSCGCFRRETTKRRWSNRLGKPFTLEKGESCFNALFYRYKNCAKKRTLEFSLTKEQFRDLTKSNCYLCGISPQSTVKGLYKNGNYIYNGIDRLDNNKGYIEGNVKSCCKICNRIKWTFSLHELKNRLIKILESLNDQKL